MTTTITPLPHDVPSKSRSRRSSARFFYVASALIIVVLAFIGFSNFYLHGRAYPPDREIAPPIKTLVIAHSASMSLWLLLMVAQPLLIERRKHRVHMTLGKIGAALAGVIVILGVMVAIRSASVTPPGTKIWGLEPRPFMAVPLFSILAFAAFVSLGVYHRKKPAIHRSMMLLATLSILGAAVSRIVPLSNLYIGTVWERLFGPFLLTLVLGVVLLAIRSTLTRSLDRSFAIGLGALIVINAVTMQVAPTEAWARIATILVP